MRNVLADLALEWEAAAALALRLAARAPTTDRIAGDDAEAAEPARVATAGRKYWVCKRGPATSARRWSAWAATATSRTRACRASTARAPLNSIWEGSAATSRPSTCCALTREDPARSRRSSPRSPLAPGRRRPASTPSSPTFATNDRRRCHGHRDPRPPPRRAHGPRPPGLPPGPHGTAAVADAFCASRLAGDWGQPSAPSPPACSSNASSTATAPSRRPEVSDRGRGGVTHRGGLLRGRRRGRDGRRR